MIHLLTVAACAAASLLCASLLPAVPAFVGAAVFGVGASVLASRHFLPEYKNAEWRIIVPRRGRAEVVCVSEALLRGKPGVTADVRLPFDLTPPERFRSLPGAMLFSAAASLAPGTLPDEALLTLGIHADNFRRRCPVLRTVERHGLCGAAVRDGAGERVYFAAPSHLLVGACELLSGDSTPLSAADRDALASLPGLHYATASLADGRVGPLVYLGSLLPREVPAADPDALLAIDRLRDAGLEVAVSGECSFVSSVGLRLPPCPDEGGLRVEMTGASSPRFDLPVLDYLAHRRTLCALRRFFPAAAALFLLAGFLAASASAGAAAALAAVCVPLMASRKGSPLPSAPGKKTLPGLAVSAIIALASGLFLRAVGSADFARIALLCVWSCLAMLCVFPAPLSRVSGKTPWLLLGFACGAVLLSLLSAPALQVLFAALSGLLSGLCALFIARAGNVR